MTFQDLRSGCCSTIRTPTTTRLVKTSSLQQIASSQRCCLTGPHTFIAFSFFDSPHTKYGKNLNTMKASVPKLFNCPGAINVTFTSLQKQNFIDQRGRSRPLDELTTPWNLSQSVRKDNLRSIPGSRLMAPRPYATASRLPRKLKP